MAEGINPSIITPWGRIRRAAVGLLLGGAVGAILGVLALILIAGWGDYTRSLSDTRPTVFGTQAGLTRGFTVGFAFVGAMICGFMGMGFALSPEFRQPEGNQERPEVNPGDHPGSDEARI